MVQVCGFSGSGLQLCNGGHLHLPPGGHSAATRFHQSEESFGAVGCRKWSDLQLLAELVHVRPRFLKIVEVFLSPWVPQAQRPSFRPSSTVGGIRPGLAKAVTSRLAKEPAGDRAVRCRASQRVPSPSCDGHSLDSADFYLGTQSS